MKIRSCITLAMIGLSSLCSAQTILIDDAVRITGEPTGILEIASLEVRPELGAHIAIAGVSTNNVGVYGHSVNVDGIFGSTVNGVGGHFTTFGAGAAVVAVSPCNPIVCATGNALEVDGGVLIKRDPRNLIKVYDPTTGMLIGSFEFEVVAAP